MIKTILLSIVSLLIGTALLAATYTQPDYSGMITSKVLVTGSTSWKTVTITYTNITSDPINLQGLNLCFNTYSDVQPVNPYFTSLCGVTYPSLNNWEEIYHNGPFTFYDFNLQFNDPNSYTLLNPNCTVELTFGFQPSENIGDSGISTGTISPGYHFKVTNDISNANITQIGWMNFTANNTEGCADNGIGNDIPTQYMQWFCPSVTNSTWQNAGVLYIQGINSASGTNKLVAVTPEGFYVASPADLANDKYEVETSYTDNLAEINLVTTKSYSNSSSVINEQGEFTIKDNTKGFYQYGQNGIPCIIHVLSSNGVNFYNSDNSAFKYAVLSPDNGQDTVSYTVTNDDSAAIVDIGETYGCPMTQKLLVITKYGIFQGSEFNSWMDDFTLSKEANVKIPTYDITPCTENVKAKQIVNHSC